jgi:hypothetical protein
MVKLPERKTYHFTPSVAEVKIDTSTPPHSFMERKGVTLYLKFSFLSVSIAWIMNRKTVCLIKII